MSFTEFTKPTRDLHNKRFGMFVHLGLFSAHKGVYKGKKTDGLGEWLMRNMEIPIEEYKKGIPDFVPTDDWAENLVATAVDAGMKYIVLTAKHHDGYCLFKSDVSDYNVYTYTGRDLVKELSQACKEAGISLGVYYSQCLDWYEKDGAGLTYAATGAPAKNDNFWDYPERDKKDFSKYFYGKAIPQVKELLTRYGDVSIIWFDFPHDITPKQACELDELVHKLQPNCSINSRIAHGYGDYLSLGDNSLPAFPLGFPVECLVTLNHTWGYVEHDKSYKSSEAVVEILARCISADATYLLNVGPRGDGSLTDETKKLLADAGKWVRQNSDAVYNVSGTPFAQTFSFGYVAKKGNALYLYITDKNCKKVLLPGVSEANVVLARRMGGKSVDAQIYNDELFVSLSQNEGIIPVYEIVFDKEPTISKIVADVDGEFALTIPFAKKLNGEKVEDLYLETDIYFQQKGTYGLAMSPSCKTLSWWKKSEGLTWDVNVKNCGKYKAILETSGGKYTGGYILSVADKTNVVEKPVELGADSLNDCSADNAAIYYSLGEFEFDKKGVYTISLRRTEDGETAFVSTVKFKKC